MVEVCKEKMGTIKSAAMQGDTPLQTELKKWLQRWPWEVMGTFSLKNDNTSVETFDKNLRRWANRLQDRLHIQVAYRGLITNGDSRRHAHILMLGRGQLSRLYIRRLGADLLPHGLSRKLCSYEKTMRTHGKQVAYYNLPRHLSCLWPSRHLLQPVHDLAGAAAYVGAANASSRFELISYNQKLLSKTIKEVTHAE